MRGLLILGLMMVAVGCEKKTEPTTSTPPTGWSAPVEGTKPTGSKVEPNK